MDLSGYALTTLHQDGEFVLCRARALTSPTPDPPSLLVSMLASDHPDPACVRMLEREVALRDSLSPTWALRPLVLTEYQGRPALILQDQPGEPLECLLDTQVSRALTGRPSAEPAMELGLFLRLAAALTGALGELHRRGIIHKNVKPANVLVNAATGQVWLTGFGIASRLPRERQAPEPPETIAGTLAYMAPEQTGRMNRSIDCRSDLYSVGVTLYQMLTGSLPFTAAEPIEWVHCHIARKPVPPNAVLAAIPLQLSAIVVKLLAKTPEERYQTAAGVERDLGRCLREWETRGIVDEFRLGEGDCSDRLLMPERLYGRQSQVRTLLAAFDQVVAGGSAQLVLVSGDAGIGKSSVVNELHKILVLPRGLFASGKFDQLKRDIPYATVAQAFQSLIRQLLAKPEAELSTWRDHLRQALDLNGALLTDLIPELKFIIGEQPAVPEIQPSAATARFQHTLRRFIGVFARAEHPLALFLDDLQWLDAATLDLLESMLVESELQHLLLVGAYRSNEVDDVHPLSRRLSAIREGGAIVRDVVLGPLDRDHLTQWFADAVHGEPQHVRPLAKLVHEKTAGNPFFANQFLQELVADNLITFDADRANWRWDLGPIRAKGYTDNVVDLMVAKLSRLPRATQQVLTGLACLGSSARASTLAMVQGTSEEQLDSELWEALRLELIVRSGDSYRFVHDRVQEAAYSLVSEERRAPAHLRIGRLLARQGEPDQQGEAVFEIVGHFNRAASLLTSAEDRDHVAALNLVAGKRAKKAVAFASALSYLNAGSALVAGDGWHRRHDLVFELELLRAECEFLTGDMSAAEQHLRILSSRAADTVQRSAVACLLVDVYWALQRPDRGLAECLECLRHAGLEIPMHPTKAQAQAQYDEICSKLDGVGIDELAALPLLTDPTSRAILDVVAKVAPTAVIMDMNLLSLLIGAAVDLGLERGHCDSSCFVYEFLGVMAGWHFGDLEACVRFGRLGLELVERKGLRGFESFVSLIFTAEIMPWAQHIASCRELVRTTIEIADKSGDRQSAVAGRVELVSHLLWSGEPLAEVETEAEVCLEVCRRAAFRDYIDRGNMQVAFIRSLRGLTRQFGSLDDGAFNELRMQTYFESQPQLAIPAFWHWITRLQARLWAGDYAAALDASIRAEGLISESRRRGQMCASEAFRAESEFYCALAHTTACDPASGDDSQQHVNVAAGHLQVLELWARHCPENFENRAALVAAELARIEARDRDAAHLYEQAIRSARENGFVHHGALALELAARFYAARGFDRIATAYLRDARSGYRQWGAEGKVRQLEAQYPYLRDAEPQPGPKRTAVTPVEHLDLSTVLRVSQAVQGETDLQKLIAAIMRLALEHAGAERGLLIVQHGDAYRIEAEASSDNDGVAVDLRHTAIGVADLPQSVLQYVLRTRERVLLQDASAATEFADDEYLRRHRARSVLCIPLLKQARLAGIIYLENNLTADAFTPARIALLEVLASAAAISLENALLYHDLEERERESRLIVETVPGMVATLSAAGELEFVNKGLIEYCGQGLEEMKQWGTNGTVHTDDLPHVVDLFAQGITSGEPYDFDMRVRRVDGVYRWFHVRGFPLRDMGGQVVRWYSLLSDIDDRKRAEAELRALKDQLYKENLVLRDEVDRTSMFEEIVGTSRTLQPVLSRIAKVARTDSTVLVTGETGTGKELVARAIHRRSARASRAFVSVNCAAIPRELIASELFGHEKGAFTGATQRRLGRFELAHGGTIFLDEAGELPMETQVALLRVLQEREFERVGGNASIRIDVRVIAATNRDLQAAIDAGAFRSDLFYRLNVFPIAMPALRERADDIPLLVEYFIDRYARNAGKTIRRVNKRTLDHLRSYPWPGNVRELQNVIERSVIVCDTDEFTVDESWLSTRPAIAGPLALSGSIAAHEKAIIEDALRASGGRVFGPSGAAERLGIPRSTLESKIRALRINKSRFRSRAVRD